MEQQKIITGLNPGALHVCETMIKDGACWFRVLVFKCSIQSGINYLELDSQANGDGQLLSMNPFPLSFWSRRMADLTQNVFITRSELRALVHFNAKPFLTMSQQ